MSGVRQYFANFLTLLRIGEGNGKPKWNGGSWPLDGAEPANINIQGHISSTGNPHGVTAAQVDAYTTAQADSAITTATANKADLVAGKVPASQLPSYVDDVLEYGNLAAFPAIGESGKIYVSLADNMQYRWSGSTYVSLNAALALGETPETAYRGDRGKAAYDHSQIAHAPSNAEQNVQADWNQTDNTQDDFIKNKPTIYTFSQSVVSLSQNAATNITGHTVVSVSEQVQLDLSTTGNAISGGDYSGTYGKDKAFNDSSADRWISSQLDAAVANTAYIGQAGLSQPITTLNIINNNVAIQALANFKIQYSDNSGVSWNDIQNVVANKTLGATWSVNVNSYTPAGGTHHLRILATEATSGNNGWSLSEIAMLPAPTYNEMLPVTDYSVVRSNASGSQTLTVKRLKAGTNINHAIDYI